MKCCKMPSASCVKGSVEKGGYSLYVNPIMGLCYKKGYKKSESPKLCLELSRSKKAAMTYSPTTKCSTIGAGGLNFSVRDGKRWNPNAMIA